MKLPDVYSACKFCLLQMVGDEEEIVSAVVKRRNTYLCNVFRGPIARHLALKIQDNPTRMTLQSPDSPRIEPYCICSWSK